VFSQQQSLVDNIVDVLQSPAPGFTLLAQALRTLLCL
jgi:hypothetical protein